MTRRGSGGWLLAWMLMAPLTLMAACTSGDDDDDTTPPEGDDDTTLPGDDDDATTTGDDDDTTTGDDDDTNPGDDDDDTTTGDDDDDTTTGDDDDDTTPPGDDDDTNPGDDDDDTPVTGELTLDNCPTSIASGAPDFFKKLFRCVTVTSATDRVTIDSVGLPPHRSYYYGEGDPNYEPFDTTRGKDYHPNPNQLSEQDLSMYVPLNPKARGITINGDLVDYTAGTSQYEYRGAVVGIALDGVALFSGFAAPGDDIRQEKYTFDVYNGHPQNTGVYHYHTWTMGPLEVIERAGLTDSTEPGEADVEVYGIMCDGTVVMGCTEADGSTPSGSLDAQGGHVHDIKDAEGAVWFSNRYHTHVCESIHAFAPEIQYYDTCGSAPPGPPQ